MTSGDTRAWKEIFGRLCAIHGREWDDAQSRFYFDALKDCELADVKAAGDHLIRSSTFFPKPAEWRQEIGKRRFEARRQREMALRQKQIAREVQCAACQDTGMRVVQTEPDERMGPCPCRETNANYLITRARGMDGLSDSDTPAQIPAGESDRLIGTVRDFKRLSSGE